MPLIQSVASADLVCTCTTSAEPLFDGAALQPGVHVNAVGSYRRDARELDEVSIGRARVFVDTEVALKESGDLVFPLDEHILRPEDVTTLHDVVANDEHVIALVNATATKDGKTFKYRTAEIHHVKDGKITERWAFSDDTDAINKFFA